MTHHDGSPHAATTPDALDAGAYDAQGTDHPVHQALRRLAGRWRLEGHLGEGAGPAAAGAPATGTDHSEWLPGEVFLVNRWEHEMGGFRHAGLSVMGPQGEGEPYATRAFDNMGFARIYETRAEPGVLTLTGPWERAIVAIGEDGETLRIHWERSPDGEQWLPLCDLRGVRLT